MNCRQYCPIVVKGEDSGGLYLETEGLNIHDSRAVTL